MANALPSSHFAATGAKWVVEDLHVGKANEKSAVAFYRGQVLVHRLGHGLGVGTVTDRPLQPGKRQPGNRLGQMIFQWIVGLSLQITLRLVARIVEQTNRVRFSTILQGGWYPT